MAKNKPAELTQDDPNFLPVQYDLTQERLNQLATDYDPKLIPAAEKKGDDGYVEIHNRCMAITRVRTNIEKVRKSLKADALAWGRKVDGEARRLTEIVENLEAPWRAVKTDLDEQEAREAAEARLAEQKRLEEIEGRIAEIRKMAEGLINSTASAIKKRIDYLAEMPITEELYGDYVEAAVVTKQTVLDTLTQAHTERAAFEAQQAELARQQQELAEQQQKQAEEQKRLDDQKAAQEAAERAQREEEERKAREKQEAEAEKKREAELKKRMPEDKKLRAYASEIEVILPPKIKDKKLAAVLSLALDKRDELIDYIRNNTQGE